MLRWLRSMFPGRREEKGSTDSVSACSDANIHDQCKEDLCHLPHSLLAIGTFGTKGLREEDMLKYDLSDNFYSLEISNVLATKNKHCNEGSDMEQEKDCCEKEDFLSNHMISLNKANQVQGDNHNEMKEKSISFLLENISGYKSAFVPAPTIRELLPASRMKKVLNAILRKKIKLQDSIPRQRRKFLEINSKERRSCDKDKNQKKVYAANWDKTDSEYIVLEMKH